MIDIYKQSFSSSCDNCEKQSNDLTAISYDDGYQYIVICRDCLVKIIEKIKLINN